MFEFTKSFIIFLTSVTQYIGELMCSLLKLVFFLSQEMWSNFLWPQKATTVPCSNFESKNKKNKRTHFLIETSQINKLNLHWLYNFCDKKKLPSSDQLLMVKTFSRLEQYLWHLNKFTSIAIRNLFEITLIFREK